MNGQPKKIIRIALDDYIKGLEGRISAETLGKVKDELKRDLPNMLKDEKKHVAYNKGNSNQHAHLFDPHHPITVTHIEETEL